MNTASFLLSPALKVTLGCHRLDAPTVATAYHLSPDERGFPSCACFTPLSIVCAGEGGQFLSCKCMFEWGGIKGAAERWIMLREAYQVILGRGETKRKLQEDKSWKLSLARCRVLCKVGDCCGEGNGEGKGGGGRKRGWRSAGTKRNWPGVLSLSQHWSWPQLHADSYDEKGADQVRSRQGTQDGEVLETFRQPFGGSTWHGK